jgi:hypothetical protein
MPALDNFGVVDVRHKPSMLTHRKSSTALPVGGDFVICALMWPAGRSNACWQNGASTFAQADANEALALTPGTQDNGITIFEHRTRLAVGSLIGTRPLWLSSIQAALLAISGA